MAARPLLPSAVRGRAVVLALGLLALACGGREPLPALTDDATCAEAQAVLEVALEEGRTYVGTDRDDPVLADEIIFGLSAVDERPECFDADAIRPFRILQVTRSDFLAATRATLVRQKTKDAKQRRRQSKRGQASADAIEEPPGAPGAAGRGGDAGGGAGACGAGDGAACASSDARTEQSDDEARHSGAEGEAEGHEKPRSSSDSHVNDRARSHSGGYASNDVDDPGNQSDVL